MKIDTELNKNENIIKEIVGFIQQVNYGEVIITIHDSEIVQIEKREKKRFAVRKQL